MALSPGLDWKQDDKTLQLLLEPSAGRITWRRTAEQEETHTRGTIKHGGVQVYHILCDF